MKIVSLADAPEEGVTHNPEIRKRVLLRRGDLPHLTNFARARLLPGQTARSHAHRDMSEVFYVEAGEGSMVIDGARHALSDGVCVVVEAGESHEIENTGAAELVLLYFGVEV
jgi:mannose-6-phosphate isomerase-like protein (cupin superfamily)